MRRGSLFHPPHKSLLKQIHHEGGKVESVPSFLIKSSLSAGVTTEESKATLPMSVLWLRIPAAAEFH